MQLSHYLIVCHKLAQIIIRDSRKEESSRHGEEKEPTRKWSKERGRRVGEEDGRRVDTFEEGSVDAVAPASQWLLRHSSARARTPFRNVIGPK